jgi:hypothetical protein
MLTAQKAAAAYGVSITTVHQWRKRGIALSDFADPAVVTRKLFDTMKNASPRLLALRDKKTQMEILFRLAVSGAITPNK